MPADLRNDFVYAFFISYQVVYVFYIKQGNGLSDICFLKEKADD
jgi:hypothetical protein